MKQTYDLLITVLLLAAITTTMAADWPQFMHDAAHSGDAGSEKLNVPLNLVAQVPLDDAILSSPAVVGGRVYVVDQMGTAYCIEPLQHKILWKTSPEGDAALGSNTSSPCVTAGRVYYGTVAGNLHILDAETGRVARSVGLQWPILDAITSANESLYFQTLNGVVHCLDLDGNPRWSWSQQLLTRDNELVLGSHPRTDGTSAAYYTSNVVSVAGPLVVTALADDLVCLRDEGTQAQLVWRRSEPVGSVYTTVGASIVGDYVYVSCPGKDGEGAIARFVLADGAFDKKADSLFDVWASFNGAAVRGETMYFGRSTYGLTAYDFSTRSAVWTTFDADPHTMIPTISAPALSQEHCLFTSTDGALIAVSLQSRGAGPAALGQGLWRYDTPTGRPITSSPVIADGHVYFGSDDGCLYVLGNGDKKEAGRDGPTVHLTRSHVEPAGARRYSWPSAYGSPSNANFIDDPGLRPPFRLRYAVRSDGMFKHPVCATLDDIVYVSLEGLVVCREQATGRIRWRRKLPDQAWTRASLLVCDERVFVSRMFSPRYPKTPDLPSKFYCLDLLTGDVLWSHNIGIGDRLRCSPVCVDGVVAYGSLYETVRESPRQIVEGWDAASGEPLWRVPLNSSGLMLNGPAGCGGEGVMYFTGGGETEPRTGETIAVSTRTGEVLWRTAEAYSSQTGTPAYRDGKLFLSGAYKLPVSCLAADTGKVLWQQSSVVDRWHVEAASLGPDFFAINNKYKGGAWRWNLDGTVAGTPGHPIQLWGPAHGCGALVLASPGYALSATVEGIYAVDAHDGQILWKSPGFGSWACPNPIASNGRIFYCPQINGLLFCFEPAHDREETAENERP